VTRSPGARTSWASSWSALPATGFGDHPFRDGARAVFRPAPDARLGGSPSNRQDVRANAWSAGLLSNHLELDADVRIDGPSIRGVDGRRGGELPHRIGEDGTRGTGSGRDGGAGRSAQVPDCREGDWSLPRARRACRRRSPGDGAGVGIRVFGILVRSGGRPDGEVVCTDGDPKNARLAEDYLSTAGMWDRVRYRVGDALQGFAAEAATSTWCTATSTRTVTRTAGARRGTDSGRWLVLCDNTIWSGYVATGTDRAGQAGVTAFIREHNRLVAEDTRYVWSTVPIRDGVMTALRIE
jgi:O-methyltransferase